MSSSLGVGGALGLPAAAALAQYGSWQWMFWGSGALGVAIIVMMMVRLRTLPAAIPDGTLDVIGAVGLAIALISLLLAVSKGADWGWSSGIRPEPGAPVWRMDTFRDRFLGTFSG